MIINDLSSIAGASWDSHQMDSISGASSYVPTSSSDSSATDSVVAQMRSDIQQNSQNFGLLKGELNSNNLAGATQAFANIQQAIQNASSAAGGKSPFDQKSPIGKDFQAIGSALQSGDLSGAKQAFASFKTDIKIAGRTARAQNLQAASGDNGGDVADDAQTTAIKPTTDSTNTGGMLNATA
jgi:hypothetical protein